MIRGGSIVLAAAAWLAVTAGSVSAQNANPPRAARPAAGVDGLLNNEVDDLLQRWHEKTSKVRQVFAKFQRSVVDKAFKTKRENDGAARFRDPNLARMDISNDKNGNGREIFILSEQPRPAGGKGLEIQHYIVGERRLEINEFPIDAVHNAQEEGPLRLLFGVKPETAHARYGFEILKKTADSITVRISPKLEADRQEFLEAVLMLDTKSFMPRRLDVKENADTDVSYVFSMIVTNIDDPELEILVTDFDPPKINKKDWKVTRQKLEPEKSRQQAGARQPTKR
jgi:hypothetical protein